MLTVPPPCLLKYPSFSSSPHSAAPPPLPSGFPWPSCSLNVSGPSRGPSKESLRSDLPAAAGAEPGRKKISSALEENSLRPDANRCAHPPSCAPPLPEGLVVV